MRIYIVYKKSLSLRVQPLHILSLYRNGNIIGNFICVSPFFPGAFSPKRDVEENCLFNGEAGIIGR